MTLTYLSLYIFVYQIDGFRDVHTQILGVLHTYVATEDNAAHVYQSGCVLRLLAYLEAAEPAMKPHCLAVLTKMSFTAKGRNVSSYSFNYFILRRPTA